MSNTIFRMIERGQYAAAIFDLDGVITRTAEVHARAWKRMFDAYLQSRDEEYAPLDIDSDYFQYIDGKPRYDGVESFLESRDITIPYGAPADGPEKETICGLGNRKNDIFLELIHEEGVQVYGDTVAFIRELRDAGFGVAVISASKNCREILRAADLLHLFDARVDGVVAEKKNIEGKPAPDVFIYAAELLEQSPSECMVFEDAIAGVQAGSAGDFGIVAGVARNPENRDTLLQHGADITIENFDEVMLIDERERVKRSPGELPSALAEESKFKAILEDQNLAIFLDYDGTLTPIVSRPEDAKMSGEMRDIVHNLSEAGTLAVISGRDRKDVEHLVGLPDLVYAGSHGFDISGPQDMQMDNETGEEFLPALDEAEEILDNRLAGVSGAQIERKRYSIAVHYRNVTDDDIERVRQIAENVAAKFDDLKTSGGKKIIEAQPAVDWDKGKALLWLMDALDLNVRETCPIYIGDDLTDENAFETLAGWGVGILVGRHGDDTYAKYHLKDVEEVKQFLRELTELIRESSDE